MFCILPMYNKLWITAGLHLPVWIQLSYSNLSAPKCRIERDDLSQGHMNRHMDFCCLLCRLFSFPAFFLAASVLFHCNCSTF